MQVLGSAGFFRNWVKDEDGTTAIEFSLLAIPYLTLMLGIIELSLMYASGALLEGATQHAARLVRTGQIQQMASGGEAAFRQALCDYATALVRCDNIQLEVQDMDSFSDFSSLQADYDEDGNLSSRGFSVGGSSDRVMIRTAYRYTMYTPLVGTLLNGPDGSRLFVSTFVLQTEPYEFEGFGEGST